MNSQKQAQKRIGEILCSAHAGNGTKKPSPDLKTFGFKAVPGATGTRAKMALNSTAGEEKKNPPPGAREPQEGDLSTLKEELKEWFGPILQDLANFKAEAKTCIRELSDDIHELRQRVETVEQKVEDHDGLLHYERRQ